MNRFFVSEDAIADHIFRLTGGDLHHLRKVLRLKAGDGIIVIDPNGREWESRLDSVSTEEAVGTMVYDVTMEREAKLAITLIQGLPKASKMDDIIQKGTEVGMVAFVPLACERTVVRLDDRQGAAKTARWQKIAEEAAKQSRRSMVPLVSLPQKWEEILKSKEPDTLDILLWEQETGVSLEDIWKKRGPLTKVRLLVGPEGGFTAEEAARALACGAEAVTLGPRILRTETAGLVAAACLLYASGDLGGRE